MMWQAVVRAKQGGPIYTHVFDGPVVADLLREASEALDLERADYIHLEITKVPICKR